MNLNSHELDISTIERPNYRDLIIFLIPFIVFSLYLYVFNPGVLTLDSFNQLHQIATNQFSNWHPFFHTFIEMICLKIYANPISVAVLQIWVFSSMWMIICKYHRDDNKKNNTFILQVILTCIICLIPINAIYSITLWKDVLFSYFLMFLCFLIKVMLDRDGKVDLKFVVLMALVLAITSQLRMNGMYIILISLIVLTIYLLLKKNPQKIYIALPALTLVFILLIASLNVAYDVENAQKDFVFVKTSHMLADYDLHLDLEDADRDKIHKMINEEKLNESYNIYYSDPINWISNEKVYRENQHSYLELAIKYSIKNPDRFLFYLFKSADIVWDITRDSDWNGEVYYITADGPRIDQARDKYFEAIKSTPQKSYENVTGYNAGTGKYTLLSSFVNEARENIILDTLFNSPALYMYLAIALLIAMHIITKSRDLYLVYLPNFLNILLIFASIPVQDNRYLYANLLVCYLLIIIFMSLIESSKESNAILSKKHEEAVRRLNEENSPKDTLNNPHIEDSNPKTEVMPPQREETSEEMEARIRAEIHKELEMEKQRRK
ncbi:hypothetical protein [Methanobrevibacter sp.]|uniref:hypothetical protein n=1 Tax=Methanobrevibacter sp. TaxID=66852 RepID=UPI0025D0951E|nr:hypothetical protein [Methanobrevibacter sp.]MBQ6512908.1 hypothetical protein [Methanobrevibacter sp.]